VAVSPLAVAYRVLQTAQRLFAIDDRIGKYRLIEFERVAGSAVSFRSDTKSMIICLSSIIHIG
jgi:division protein CdvB (Snf7/Vps24/ESCRT-III family)